jgi:3-hydroxy-9,10-secoandrosta-1,3,5(10)-triene-9,17-dione monooxygenase
LQVARADGGYRISGRSTFASGVGHCTWVFVGGLVEAQGKHDPVLFLVPPGDYRVDDVWFTTGMCATGSNTIVTDSAFVPERRVVRLADLGDGKTPGGAIHAGPIYRAPLISYAPISFAGPMLGAAQGAYENFRNETRTRTSSRGGSVAEMPNVQVRLARTAADLDAGEFLLRRATDVARAATPPSLALRARSMRDYARVAELAVSAIDSLISMSGTAGFATSHPIQRAWRDTHFSAMHISINPDSNYAHYGRMELGLPRDPRQIFY